LVQLCSGGGRVQTETSLAGDGISLRSFDARGNLKAEFQLNRLSAGGLVSDLDNTLTQVGAAQAKVRMCLQSMRDRLLQLQSSVQESAASPGPIASAPSKLVPVREYLPSVEIPFVSTRFGAYGIMAFRAKPTSVTRERLKMACASFTAYLARQADVPRSVLLIDRMLTIWPLDEPNADEAKKDNCDFLVDHYELYAADSAISDAEKQGAQFGSDGPFLIGWSPSNTRGVPDKLVLVVDMSSYSSQDSFNQALRFWKEKIVEDPALWRSGFSLEKFRLSVRDFVDHYGETILAAAHLSKG
jgi:hypothetical protein